MAGEPNWTLIDQSVTLQPKRAYTASVPLVRGSTATTLIERLISPGLNAYGEAAVPAPDTSAPMSCSRRKLGITAYSGMLSAAVTRTDPGTTWSTVGATSAGQDALIGQHSPAVARG